MEIVTSIKSSWPLQSVSDIYKLVLTIGISGFYEILIVFISLCETAASMKKKIKCVWKFVVQFGILFQEIIFRRVFQIELILLQIWYMLHVRFRDEINFTDFYLFCLQFHSYSNCILRQSLECALLSTSLDEAWRRTYERLIV